MPSLSWNEIRQRAIAFSHDFKGTTEERAEAQSFWNEFFHVFGIKRRTVASFEEPVKSLKNTKHRIDLFWKGTLLAEHKSTGQSLEKAGSQAFQYIQELQSEGRADEIPRYIVLSDFARVVLHDLEPEPGDPPMMEFALEEFHQHVKHFAFLIGQKTHKFGEEDPANLEAAALMADLHDTVADGGYRADHLERLLVRLLFCLFGDDTGIFERGQFGRYIAERTREDGSDLGPQLAALFEVLNTPDEKRSKHLDEDLAAFPYINGQLFADHLSMAGFSAAMRTRLAAACRFDWSRISPAIFGSLFQGIMDSKERRQLGAHYTSERDILKVIKPLFLDALREEFEQIRKDSRPTQRNNRLQEFQIKLGKLKFLDPACGCGNFLVIAYRELRRLELDVLKARHNFDSREWDLNLGVEGKMSVVDVDQFYGIEIGEWPARIAETALWLTDHQMNTILSLSSGNNFQRIPLKASPHIHCANALRMDWNELLPASECSYVLGNPPFIGKKEQNAEQKADHVAIWGKVSGAGILDYVTCWYVLAAQFVQSQNTTCAFVSTNSISQGEQVSVLWDRLLNHLGVRIHFAHTTFNWRSEARGAAHVHVVIVGFAAFDVPSKRIFSCDISGANSFVHAATNINPYLVDAPNVLVVNRKKPISKCPAMNYGSMMIDKPRSTGLEEGFIIDEEERQLLLAENPPIEPFVRQLFGGEEFIQGTSRWCLWLADAPPSILKTGNRLRRRLERIQAFRLESNREATRKLASMPYRFGEVRQPNSDYILVPKVSSQTRKYMPIGILPPSIIASGSALVVPNATTYSFGVLTSAMHMDWMRVVCGRMKSDYQYSVSIVYNNFPWPESATNDQRTKVEECAQAVLDARQGHLDNGATLADLYDPLYMPAPLLKAHQNLDRAVDRCYRKEKFDTERERVEFLFGLYEALTHRD